MWLLNVVVIITFMYFIIQVLMRAIKDKNLTMYILIVVSVIFEIVLIIYMLNGAMLSTALQTCILIFSYILPIVIVAISSISIKLKLNILYAIAKLTYNFEKYEFAEGLLAGIIKNDRKTAKYYYLRGKALEKLDNLKEARDMLFKVIELERDNKEAYLDLALILDKEDKKDTALVMLAQALKLDENYDAAKELMGIIYSELGWDKEAELIYTELSENGNGTYKTYYNLAIIYLKRGNNEKAIEAYKTTIEKNNKMYEAYYALGKLYYANGEFDECINSLQFALKDENLKTKAKYYMALSYMKNGDEPQAMEYLNRVIQEDKTYLEIAEKDRIFEGVPLETIGQQE